MCRIFAALHATAAGASSTALPRITQGPPQLAGQGVAAPARRAQPTPTRPRCPAPLCSTAPAPARPPAHHPPARNTRNTRWWPPAQRDHTSGNPLVPPASLTRRSYNSSGTGPCQAPAGELTPYHAKRAGAGYCAQNATEYACMERHTGPRAHLHVTRRLCRLARRLRAGRQRATDDAQAVQHDRAGPQSLARQHQHAVPALASRQGVAR